MTNELGVKGGPIDGVIVVRRNKIPDERGSILHMLKKEDPEFIKFGEIYFSNIFPNVIKGWHIHSKMELNYVTVVGDIKLVLYDDREGSKTRGGLMEIFMGERNSLLVKVPKMIWNGFKCVGLKEAVVANCSSLSHDPGEIKRLDPLSKEIPYDWTLKNG